MGLHKNEIWNYEDEIRFLSYYEYDNYTKDPGLSQSQAAKLYHSFTAKGKPYSYLELPLYGNKRYLELQEVYKKHSISAKFTDSLPILKIHKIILGYNNSTDTFHDCRNIINQLSETYKYRIGLESSYLEEYMR